MVLFIAASACYEPIVLGVWKKLILVCAWKALCSSAATSIVSVVTSRPRRKSDEGMKGSDATDPAPPRTWPMTEIAKHRTHGDAWVVIDGSVYDVSSWALQHPGGSEIILACAGGDATREFSDVGHSNDAREKLDGLQIGVAREATSAEIAEEAAAVESKDVIGEAVYLVGAGTSPGVGAASRPGFKQKSGGVASKMMQRMPSMSLTYPSVKTGIAVGVALTAVVITHRTVMSMRSSP